MVLFCAAAFGFLIPADKAAAHEVVLGARVVVTVRNYHQKMVYTGGHLGTIVVNGGTTITTLVRQGSLSTDGGSSFTSFARLPSGASGQSHPRVTTRVPFSPTDVDYAYVLEEVMLVAVISLFPVTLGAGLGYLGTGHNRLAWSWETGFNAIIDWREHCPSGWQRAGRYFPRINYWGAVVFLPPLNFVPYGERRYVQFNQYVTHSQFGGVGVGVLTCYKNNYAESFYGWICPQVQHDVYGWAWEVNINPARRIDECGRRVVTRLHSLDTYLVAWDTCVLSRANYFLGDKVCTPLTLEEMARTESRPRRRGFRLRIAPTYHNLSLTVRLTR